VIVFLSALFLFVVHWRGGAEAGLPIFLHAGRKLVEMRKQHSDFPHFLLAESLIPSRHTGVTYAGANGVENVPLGIIGRIGNEIWRRRIKGVRQSLRLAVEASVAEGAVHGVELHAVFQVFVGGRQRIVDAGSVTLHGGIDRAHGQMTFEMRGLNVCTRGEKSEHGETKTTEDEDEKTNDHTESELAHEASGVTIVADAGAND